MVFLRINTIEQNIVLSSNNKISGSSAATKISVKLTLFFTVYEYFVSLRDIQEWSVFTKSLKPQIRFKVVRFKVVMMFTCAYGYRETGAECYIF